MIPEHRFLQTSSQAVNAVRWLRRVERTDLGIQRARGPLLAPHRCAGDARTLVTVSDNDKEGTERRKSKEVNGEEHVRSFER